MSIASWSWIHRDPARPSDPIATFSKDGLESNDMSITYFYEITKA